METGRKFYVTVGGMVLVFVLGLLGILWAADPAAAIGAIAFMVGAFCGANAVATWNYDRNASSNVSDSRSVSERRDVATGIEPSP